MIKCVFYSKSCSISLGLVLFVFPLVSSGCQPEGVGTMKPPGGVRPSDSSVGRPFGNPPDPKLLKKSPAAKSETPAADPNVKIVNPRL
jgi:hypothetical protein